MDTEIYRSFTIVHRSMQICAICDGSREKTTRLPDYAFRRLTDDLDDTVLDYVSNEGEASVGRIAMEIEKPYSTVMVRCLKLEAAGFLHSMWYGNERRFHVAKQEGVKMSTEIGI